MQSSNFYTMTKKRKNGKKSDSLLINCSKQITCNARLKNYESLRNVIVFDLNYNVLHFGHVEGSLFMHKFRTNIFEISSYKIRNWIQFCSSLFSLQSINGACLEPQALNTTKTVAGHNYISMNCCTGLSSLNFLYFPTYAWNSLKW